MNYLVVDDEPAICDGTIRRLRKIIRPGDRIWAAYSGEEALEILAAESIAVLINDIQMDALSGLGLIERAEKLQPIPMACIVITAHEIFEYARRAMELGVRDYLLKPYSESELTAAVSKAVATLENQWLLGRMKLEKALLAQEPSEIAPEWFDRYAPPSCRRSGGSALSPTAKGYGAALPLVLSDPRRRADAFFRRAHGL